MAASWENALPAACDAWPIALWPVMETWRAESSGAPDTEEDQAFLLPNGVVGSGACGGRDCGGVPRAAARWP